MCSTLTLSQPDAASARFSVSVIGLVGSGLWLLAPGGPLKAIGQHEIRNVTAATFVGGELIACEGSATRAQRLVA